MTINPLSVFIFCACTTLIRLISTPQNRHDNDTNTTVDDAESGRSTKDFPATPEPSTSNSNKNFGENTGTGQTTDTTAEDGHATNANPSQQQQQHKWPIRPGVLVHVNGLVNKQVRAGSAESSNGGVPAPRCGGDIPAEAGNDSSLRKSVNRGTSTDSPPVKANSKHQPQPPILVRASLKGLCFYHFLVLDFFILILFSCLSVFVARSDNNTTTTTKATIPKPFRSTKAHQQQSNKMSTSTNISPVTNNSCNSTTTTTGSSSDDDSIHNLNHTILSSRLLISNQQSTATAVVPHPRSSTLMGMKAYHNSKSKY